VPIIRAKQPLDPFPWHTFIRAIHGAKRPSSSCPRCGAARARGVGLPLVHRHVDLRHRCRASLVDLVIGPGIHTPLTSATVRAPAASSRPPARQGKGAKSCPPYFSPARAQTSEDPPAFRPMYRACGSPGQRRSRSIVRFAAGFISLPSASCTRRASFGVPRKREQDSHARPWRTGPNFARTLYPY
jgi:hypothetical protein